MALLIEDLKSILSKAVDAGDLVAVLNGRGVRTIDADDWFRLDEEEKRCGEAKGKIRDKFTTIQDMLSFLDG